MERTEILNQAECGYNYFVTMGKTIIACGLKGGVQKLDIIRVIVVSDNSAKPVSFLSKMGITKSDIIYDVDVDIYASNGIKIEVHSSEPKFLKKLIPYIWELKRKDPRLEFYGDKTSYTAETAIDEEVRYSEEQLEILTEQIVLERKIYASLGNQLNTLLLHYDEDHPKVLAMQKRILSSRKRILRMSEQLNAVTNRLVQDV